MANKGSQSGQHNLRHNSHGPSYSYSYSNGTNNVYRRSNQNPDTSNPSAPIQTGNNSPKPCCAQAPCFHTYAPKPNNSYCYNPCTNQYCRNSIPPKIICCPPGGWNPCKTTGSELQKILRAEGHPNEMVGNNKKHDEKHTKTHDKKQIVVAAARKENSTSSYDSSTYDSFNSYDYSSGEISAYNSNSYSRSSGSYEDTRRRHSKDKSKHNKGRNRTPSIIKSRSHEGMDFCFNPAEDLATEVTVTIEPEEPDPLEYALDNGIMPIICGYMPPSAAPVVPEFILPSKESNRKLFVNKQNQNNSKLKSKPSSSRHSKSTAATKSKSKSKSNSKKSKASSISPNTDPQKSKSSNGKPAKASSNSYSSSSSSSRSSSYNSSTNSF